jgi:hypothetical protein
MPVGRGDSPESIVIDTPEQIKEFYSLMKRGQKDSQLTDQLAAEALRLNPETFAKDSDVSVKTVLDYADKLDPSGAKK